MRLAIWIMSRFSVNPSLTGDLAEEWAHGRSPLWLARQTSVAIASALRSGLWDQKWMTLRSLAAGWGTAAGWFFLLQVVQPPVGVRYKGGEWNRMTIFSVLFVVTILVMPAIATGLSVRLHRVQRLGILCVQAFITLIGIIYTFAAHWTEWQHSPVRDQASFEVLIHAIMFCSMLKGGLLAARRGESTA